jgi:hypothetical protein
MSVAETTVPIHHLRNDIKVERIKVVVIMDYEQKYKEALEIAKSKIKNDKDNVLYEDDIMEIFPTLKDDRMREMAIKAVHAPEAQSCIKSWGINPEDVIAWLERQGEQEYTDKLEPNFNFKVGQWIVATGKCVYLIVKIDVFNVTLVDTNGDEYVFDASSFEDAHEWTIEDVKEGDVLSFNDGHGNDCIELIKSVANNKIEFWFCLTNGEQYEVFDGIIPYTNLSSRENATPATKEQRDLLFKKMKEAGYEWDAEKKELKKIEYKHICELNNSYACVTFPFKAKVKSSGAIVTIHDGQLSPDGKEWIKYQSDAEDRYKVYEPNDLELVCEIEQKTADNVIEGERPLLEKFKKAAYDCAWGKVTCKKEGETKEEYANRWAEQFLIIVRDWAIKAAMKEVTKDKESAIQFLKSSGIMDDNGKLAKEYVVDGGEQKTDWRQIRCFIDE